MNRDAAFQARAVRADLTVPAESAWLVFTDQVLYAELSGQHPLINVPPSHQGSTHTRYHAFEHA